jgi:hypothetical protein
MLNRQIIWILIIIGVGTIMSVISYKESSNLCYIQQLDLASQMKKYDTTKDAQLCDTLDAKISKFNLDCKSNIEELDCG